MYAIVKTGGKQYRVEQGQSLLVERLPVDDGAKATLEPLLYVDGSNVVDGDELSKVTIEARVVGHERGPKLRIVKFKPKRGYKRRTGHRQELTRIEVTQIRLASRRASSSRQAPKPVAAEGSAAKEAPKAAGKTEKPAAGAGKAEKPAAGAGKAEGETPKAAPRPRTRRPKTESTPDAGASESSTPEAGNGA